MRINPKFAVLSLMAAGAFTGCSSPTKSPEVDGTIRHALDNAGMKDVSVAQDRDKGVVTLGGHVAADSEKAQAESLAVSLAAGQVVSNQIVVTPVGAEHEARAITADLDQAIEKNLDAAFIPDKLRDQVKFTVKSGVVTLTGNVVSEGVRARAASIAAGVPNVQQVVNELQIKNQKATSN